MQSWLTLIPPVIVLILAIVTRKVLPSLIIGILSACIIVTNFSIWQTILLFSTRTGEQLFDPQNILTFGFLIILGMIITLVNISGGTNAYGILIKKVLKTARSAKFSSIALSLLFMIDDFFSTLTVGCIMKPLTDSFGIPRVKLAFLIDALAAPMVIIVPISTWIAILLMQLNKAGISDLLQDNPIILADPFMTYLHVIPFTLYSFAILTSVWFIVYYSISFGSMKTHELIAQQTGNLFGGRPPLLVNTENQSCASTKGKVSDFVVPIALLVIFCAFFICYSGNLWILGGNASFLETIQKADIFFALFMGSLIAFLLSFVWMLTRNTLTIKQFKPIAQGGWNLMGDSLAVLLFAWIFSSVLKDDLQTGQYLAYILVGTIPIWFLPSMFFIASLITSIATGSSWGTIAVMIPIAIPMLASLFQVNIPAAPITIPDLYPLIGAIFSGSVAGDHISPIAPTTIMSATSSGSYLADHVYTQLPYAIPSIISSLIGYCLIGILLKYGYSLIFCAFFGLISAIIFALTLLWFSNLISHKISLKSK